MPLRCLLQLFFLIPVCLPVNAQIKKAPPTRFSEVPQNKPDPYLKDAGIREYRQVSFNITGKGVPDTFSVQHYRIDRSGRVEELRDEAYLGASERMRLRPGLTLPGPLRQQGTLTRYRYDNAGNVIIKAEYQYIYGVNALFPMLRRNFRRMEPDAGEEPEAFKTRRRREIADWIARMRDYENEVGWLVSHYLLYSYDKAGNILTVTDTVAKKRTLYDYQYDPQGRVQRQRSVFMEADGRYVGHFAGEEIHFTYTEDGLPASYVVYHGSRDTGDLVKEAQRRFSMRYHYNSDGDPDTIDIRDRDQEARHLIRYAGGKQSDYLILAGTSGRDTTDWTTYDYKDGRLTEESTVTYSGGRRSRIDRGQYTYNAKRLPVEHLVGRQGMAYSESDQQMQSLFFYGDAAADAATAKRLRTTGLPARDVPRSPAPVIRGVEALVEPGAGTAVGVIEAPQAPQVFKFVEQMPRFDGNLDDYKRAKLRYPASQAADSSTHTPVVQFVVNEDGGISRIEVVRSGGAAFDAAATAFVRGMPTWIPGKQQGKAVKVYMTLRIGFDRSMPLDSGR